MKAYLLSPNNPEAGREAETIAIFAARRCRTTKSHQELWEEVALYSDEKRREFLSKVVTEDWAADVLEMIHLVYDIEDAPVWLVIELLRHRLIAREFSLEQLSQRAISASKLKVETQNSAMRTLVNNYLENISKLNETERLPPEELREVFP